MQDYIRQDFINYLENEKTRESMRTIAKNEIYEFLQKRRIVSKEDVSLMISNEINKFKGDIKDLAKESVSDYLLNNNNVKSILSKQSDILRKEKENYEYELYNTAKLACEKSSEMFLNEKNPFLVQELEEKVYKRLDEKYSKKISNLESEIVLNTLLTFGIPILGSFLAVFIGSTRY